VATGDQDEMLGASVAVPAFFNSVFNWLTQLGISSGRRQPDAQGHQP
jgi:hypothetical protein